MKQLTEAGVDRLSKAPKGKRHHVFDAAVPGLAVRVTDSGSKSYIVVTRIGGGRQVWITLKLKPGPGTLTGARAQAREIVAAAAEGRDPRRVIAARQAEAARENETTVASVYDRYLKRLKGGAKSARTGRVLAPATISKIEACFNGDVLPTLGAVPIADVTRADILTILDAKADSGRAVAANRARAYMHVFFEYARERDLVTENVVAGTKKASKEHSRERALGDAELRAVWKAADVLPWQACAAVRLLMLLGQRPSEVVGMRWSEIQRDGDVWTWNLPGARTKNARDHANILPSGAVELLEALPRLVGSDFVLPSNRRGAHVALGAKFKAALDARMAQAGEAVPAWQWRDLRRSVATGMERLGISTRIVAAVLNHSPPGLGITAVYARHDYQREAAEALDRWSQHVAALVEPNVVSMREVAS